MVAEAVSYTHLDVYKRQALKQWRNEKAMELNSPHFIICHNSELISIAKTKPKTVLDFKKIKGFGELKTKKFANEIISLLKTF